MKKSILSILLFTLILASCEAPRKCSAYPKSPKKNIYSPSHNL